MSTLLTRLSKWYPLALCVLVLLSVLFPGRQRRQVDALNARLDSLDAINASLRNDIVQLVGYVRQLYDGDASPADVPDGAFAGDAPLFVSGGRYTRCAGVDGVGLGADTWLIGDQSPWGVIASAYPGGFQTDLGCFTFFELTKKKD